MADNTKNQVASLVLVAFRSRHLTPEVGTWKEQSAVPSAESCSRQVWYGTEKDFTDFPTTPNVTFLRGAEAYKLLLSLISGFESKKTAETHIRHQFFKNWRTFEKNHNEIADNYRSLIKQLRADTNYIQDYIANDWKVQREEHASTSSISFSTSSPIAIVT